MKTVFFLAGEPSGDLYAGLVARALRERDSSVRMLGIGGPEMRAAGVELVEGMSELGVFGFWDGVTSAGRMRLVMHSIKAALRDLHPDVFVPVSFAGVNLELARFARHQGIKVVYLAPPQLWAWGKWRAKKLAASADKVICLFPFEEPFLRALGANASYLGNPLVDSVKPRMNADEREPGHQEPSEFPPPEPRPLTLRLLLMPGSRESEIRRHLPLMRAVGEGLRQDVAGIDVSELPPSAVSRERYALMSSADLILAASGTVTLEAALLQVPMVTVYRFSALNYLAARLMVRLKYFSLPNLLLSRRVVPEFAQPDVETVYSAARELLVNQDRRRQMCLELGEVRRLLGAPGAANRIAGAILDCMSNRA
jgi:lipid-A-disaccharide synthase